MAYENPGWTAQLVVGQVRAAGGFDTSESSAFGVWPRATRRTTSSSRSDNGPADSDLGVDASRDSLASLKQPHGQGGADEGVPLGGRADRLVQSAGAASVSRRPSAPQGAVDVLVVVEPGDHDDAHRVRHAGPD